MIAVDLLIECSLILEKVERALKYLKRYNMDSIDEFFTFASENRRNNKSY